VILRIFNKIVVLALLVGLAILGLLAVLHAFDARIGNEQYRMGDLARNLNLGGVVGGINGFVDRVQNGQLTPSEIAALALILLLGLILLLLELFNRPAPRRVMLQDGTYTTRKLVEEEVVKAAGGTPGVLQSDANVQALRRPGAKVDLRANVRRGEDAGAAQAGIRDRVQEHLERRGLPVNKLNVRVLESDPRETKTRVK
jgi:hypothetical protein